jgi:hypothetical protein
MWSAECPHDLKLTVPHRRTLCDHRVERRGAGRRVANLSRGRCGIHPGCMWHPGITFAKPTELNHLWAAAALAYRIHDAPRYGAAPGGFVRHGINHTNAGRLANRSANARYADCGAPTDAEVLAVWRDNPQSYQLSSRTTSLRTPTTPRPVPSTLQIRLNTAIVAIGGHFDSAPTLVAC